MAELSITFLGTCTSQGVPMIGCDCPVCTSADPRDNRTRSSIYVASPECSWVIDTGTDFRTQCLRESLSSLDAVLYTHAHTDHIMGFDDLRAFCKNSRSIPIHASWDTMEALQRSFHFAFNGENRFPGYVLPEPHIIHGPFFLGKTEIIPLPVHHGRTLVFGYLFKRDGELCAAYLSDCKEIPTSTMDLMHGVKVLIIDALRHRPHPTHLSIEEALEVAKSIKAEKTFFTHLCHEAGHAETEKELPENVRIAFDGLKITV